jgi:hypothetical protein
MQRSEERTELAIRRVNRQVGHGRWRRGRDVQAMALMNTLLLVYALIKLGSEQAAFST